MSFKALYYFNIMKRCNNFIYELNVLHILCKMCNIPSYQLLHISFAITILILNTKVFYIIIAEFESY